MVQQAQEERVFSRASERVSGAKSTAEAKLPAWKFRVGRAWRRLNVSRLAAVPSSRYLAVAGPKERVERSLAKAVNSAGKAHSQRWVPRRAMALMFLAPRTAPLPPRPAWRPSCEMVA